jgi:hypothetical protein
MDFSTAIRRTGKILYFATMPVQLRQLRFGCQGAIFERTLHELMMHQDSADESKRAHVHTATCPCYIRSIHKYQHMHMLEGQTRAYHA